MVLAEVSRGAPTDSFFDNPVTRYSQGLWRGEYTVFDAATFPLLVDQERQQTTKEREALFAHPVWQGLDTNGELLPHGDGHTVWLLHGLEKSPKDMQTIARWIDKRNYTPTAVRMRTPTVAILDDVEGLADDFIDTLASEERVTMVGHSRGGIVAVLLGAAVARKRPELLDRLRIVRLGSPAQEPYFGLKPPMRAAVKGTFGEREHHELRAALKKVPDSVRERTYNIFTRDDAIVQPNACQDPLFPKQNIAVRGSHSGLITNANVYTHLSKLLAR